MDDDQVPIRQVRTRVVSGQVPPRTQREASEVNRSPLFMANGLR